MKTKLYTRHAQIQSRSGSPAGEMIVKGIAVPYDQPVEIFTGYTEEIAAGACKPRDGMNGKIPLYSQHREPIGVITVEEHRDDGYYIEAQISDTSAGRDTWQLVKDGVISHFSIGFIPDDSGEEIGDGHYRYSSISIYEISLVDQPAYTAATITEHRNKQTVKEESKTMSTKTSEVTELRESVEAQLTGLQTQIQAIARNTQPEDKPAALPAWTRSAGAHLKAMLDETTRAEALEVYQRAYDGGTTADLGSALKPGWVGDLTKIVDNRSVLAGIFAAGSLPPNGMSIEYAQLKANTVQVARQTAEGADLVKGKVTLETKTAPVRTLGGYSELTLQEIQRAPVNILNTHLTAQAAAVGQATDAEIRTVFNTALTTATDLTVTHGDVGSWIDAIVDAAEHMQTYGLTLDALVVAGDVFKAIAKLETNNRLLSVVAGTGANTTGRVTVKGLRGELLEIPVIADTGATAGAAAFVHSEAIRTYATPAAQLQDENVVNLSKTFSVYRYIAVAPEIPHGIINVVAAGTGGGD